MPIEIHIQVNLKGSAKPFLRVDLEEGQIQELGKLGPILENLKKVMGAIGL